MIISIEVEKSFDENQYTLMGKPLSKLGIERNFLNLTQTMYQKKATANVIFNGEKLKAFPLRSTRQGFVPHHSFTTLHWKSLLMLQIRQMKDTQAGNEDIKPSSFTYDMIICVENLKESAEKTSWDL